ncbi:hypothetical protein [Massilibacteroides sp.]|uniref:hypothetical protein n=1 Tax=Massilibacteroides sp. TaxID=2034766 RepID=UPI00261F872F|nr:hypothetical protein [Massilibacteroides sp.]MDD4515639.1 hypothetical protein [Massilibacteroides sp.]
MALIQWDDIIKRSNELKDSINKLKSASGSVFEQFEKGKITIEALQKELEGLGVKNAKLSDIEKEVLRIQKEKEAFQKKEAERIDKINKSLNLEIQTKNEHLKLQQKEISQQAKQNALIEKYANLEAKSINDLRKKQAALTALRNTLDTTSDKYKKITSELASVNNKLIENGRAVRDTRQEVGGYTYSLKEGLASLKSFALGFVGLSAAIGAIRSLSRAAKEYIDLAKTSILQEEKLTVILQKRTGATKEQVQSVIDLANVTQEQGVVDGDVLVAGAQQLSLSVKRVGTIKQLIPAIGDLLAQQKGYNATEEDAIALSKALGKAMNGSDAALKKMGVTLTDFESKMLKFGDESQRAALLTKIIKDRVGDMNAELAKTDIGKMTIMENQIENIKEDIGKDLIPIMVSFKRISLAAFKELGSVVGELAEPIKLVMDLSKAFKSTNDTTKETPGWLDRVGNSLKKMISPLRALISYNSLLIKGYREILRFLGILESEEAARAGKVRERVDELTKSFNALSDEAKAGVLKDFNKLKSQFEKGEISATDFATALNLLIQEAQTSAFKDIGDDVNDMADSFEKATKSIEDFAQEKENVFGKGGERLLSVSAPEIRNTIIPLKDDIEKQFNELQKLTGTETTKFKNYINQLLNGDGSLLERLFGGGKTGEQAAKALTETWAQFSAVYNDFLQKQIDKYDELVGKSEERIDGIKGELEAELDRIAEVQASGQAYDLSRKKALEDQLKAEQEYLTKNLAEQKKAKEKAQRMAKIEATINLASAIMQIWSQDGGNYWIKLAQTIAMAALGAVQISNISSAKYATGTEYLERGNNPKGTDTIPIWADEGEGIIPAKTTAKMRKIMPTWKTEMLPAALMAYTNGNSVMVYDNPKALKHLEGIEKNTSRDIIRDSNGKIIQESKGNHLIFYN